ATWGAEEIREQPTVGDVRWVDGEVVIDYPADGIAIDRPTATGALEAAVLDESGTAIDLPTVPLATPVDPSQLDEVRRRVEQYAAGSVTLRNDEYGTVLTFPTDVLREAVRLIRDDSGDLPSYSVFLASEPILAHAETLYSLASTRPVDGELIIDDENDLVTLIPSIPVYEPDPVTIVQAVTAAAGTAGRTGTFGYRVGDEADVSTADLEAFGIKEQLAEWTTYYRCCEARVINIQLIADASDDVWIAPGEVFDLNEIVGKRTREKGYVAAGAIIGNEVYCCDDPINIGGGTSQFTTTLYNAVFFAGLEDVDHMPHTIYFSRYPEAREATLGFPDPNLVFRNTTENWIVVRTSHTDTSVTAEIYGDNGGIVVESRLSERCCWTTPPTVYHANPDVPRGERVEVSEGTYGWTVTNYRDITHPDGTTTTEEWEVTYRGNPRIIDMHPCDAPAGTREAWDPASEACQLPEEPEGDGGDTGGEVGGDTGGGDTGDGGGG
ncbi:MAG TPA: VanW family protein, partial [Acidimicrobiia bacterium]|nr:VanW family protein [Acidimicrobiia bacterium]